MNNLTQVKLTRNGQSQVAWIPSEAAHVNYSVELKSSGEFWNVDEVYDLSVDKKLIEENARNYLSHRKGTDI